ncbi:MAG: hypothetical protein ACLUPK_03660 [Veillonella sp.]
MRFNSWKVLDRDMVGVLLHQREYIDVVIPRGGAGLIRRVVDESKYSLLLKREVDVCHTFVDEYATSRYGVRNCC